MLASVRENLKGTLVVVVVIIFIVPMVISGVGTTFLGSVAGTDAASVDGETISNVELERAVRLRRAQLLEQQGANASSEFLTDERLRGPVLDSLTRRLALVTNGQQAGMGMSPSVFEEALRSQEAFFTDGKFNQLKFTTLLAQNGLTPSTYKKEVESDVIVRQQALGLQLSGIYSTAQFEQIVKLSHQKRSFFEVKIPLEQAEKDIKISEEDLQDFYDQNKSDYEIPQKLKVSYLELSVEALAESINVSDDEIQQQYDAEIANFSSDASYSVAHILLEGESKAKSEELAQKLSAGDNFEELAKVYSDDFASAETGGELGILTPGMFPEEFENAVYELEEGEVSSAVETDAGIHFIKVIQKVKTDVPSLDQRRDSIRSEIAKAKAADDFGAMVDTLGELTYFSEDLSEASEQLGLSIQSSSFFDKQSGSGIAESDAVRAAAFDEKVLSLGQNSNTIELAGDRVIVLRLEESKPAYLKSLEEVLPVVEARVKQLKINEELEALATRFESGVTTMEEAEALALELGYSYNNYELVNRSDLGVEQDVIVMAFLAAKPAEGALSFESGPSRDGSYRVVGVSDLQDGALSDLSDEERSAFSTQIEQGLSSLTGTSYEESVARLADIELN